MLKGNYDKLNLAEPHDAHAIQGYSLKLKTMHMCIINQQSVQ